MKQFSIKVNLRNKCEMINFLKNHFRYNTMNSWNHSTSYACNIKIFNLGLPSEIQDKLSNLIEIEEFWNSAREIFDDFGRQRNYLWQVGVNGRSGGYLVLYQGYTETSEYKSSCVDCGQKNFKPIAENGNICGKCHEQSRVDYSTTQYRIGTYPGRSTDMSKDFDCFTMNELRERVKLVKNFDKVADDLVTLALKMLNEFTIENETYYIPQTRNVLVAKRI